MKQICYTIFIILFFLFGTTEIFANETRITLSLRKSYYPAVLEAIEQQSGYHFSYNPVIFNQKKPIDLEAHEEPVTQLLARLLSPANIEFNINKKTIILRKKATQIVISGFVRDQSSLEALIGASVIQLGTRSGTATSQQGFFSITVSPDTRQLSCSYIGYEDQIIRLNSLQKDTSITIELIPHTSSLKEVVVSGNTDPETRLVHAPQMGAIHLTKQTIKQTPVLFGESDIIKTLQLTPGVAVGTEGTAGLYVRGGNLDENLFLIDGNPVYQVNHIGGVFSAFNPEAVHNLEFLKGGFPARYGGRLSSIVDIQTPEGNMKTYHGSASVGLISGNLSLEGPIIKNKTSFHIALRRTWLDVLTAPTLAIINKVNKDDGKKMRGRYAFHDLNGKITHRLNNRSRIFVSIYNGNDVMEGGNSDFSVKNEVPIWDNQVDANMRWGNILVTAGWSHMFNHKLFGKVSGLFSRYHSKLSYIQKETFGEKQSDMYQEQTTENMTSNRIRDLGIRSAFDYQPNDRHHVRFGGDLLFHNFQPEFSRFTDKSTQDSTVNAQLLTDDTFNARELALFAEDEWEISPRLKANGGIRLSLFNIQKHTYVSAEPRLSLRWLLQQNVSVKTAYARMAQYVHLLSNSFLNLPTDSWIPVTKNIKPLLSDQISAGVYYSLNKTYQFSVEGYYKKMHNLLDYKDGFSFLPGTAKWDEKLTRGEGKAYGCEMMIRKETGRTTGWIGYTLSWANRRFDEINDGVSFPARYDNRHKLNIVVTHRFTPRVELTGAWTYASGNRTTLTLENYVTNDQDYSDANHDYYTTRNNFQMPDFHRLDLSMNIYMPKKSGRTGIWNVSIYNAYNRINTFMIYKTTKYVGYERRPRFQTMGFMPIIPSVSYTYKF
ncbi:MAG: carboxypeptidase-like regulatory domain-containing protein [Bacteroidales bacterium]